MYARKRRLRLRVWGTNKSFCVFLGRGSRYAKIKMYLIYNFFKLILEQYAFYKNLQSILYSFSQAGSPPPPPSWVQSVSLSSYRGMLSAFAWTERAISIRNLHSLRVESLSVGRVSFETSFDSKQPKLEPKLVSALSETKRFVSVVSLLCRNREFRCFDWTETNRRPTETVW